MCVCMYVSLNYAYRELILLLQWLKMDYLMGLQMKRKSQLVLLFCLYNYLQYRLGFMYFK